MNKCCQSWQEMKERVKKSGHAFTYCPECKTELESKWCECSDTFFTTEEFSCRRCFKPIKPEWGYCECKERHIYTEGGTLIKRCSVCHKRVKPIILTTPKAFRAFPDKLLMELIEQQKSDCCCQSKHGIESTSFHNAVSELTKKIRELLPKAKDVCSRECSNNEWNACRAEMIENIIRLNGV